MYGQNGSGKTVLIDALQLLKFALSGKAIPSKYEHCLRTINAGLTIDIVDLGAALMKNGGIFEYLLGELLNIISEKGKGQLIFTSHNLSPLETINKGFVAFTTTNPEMRYIRMGNVKGTNNLRDFYYRDIVLGEQNEQVYNHTNNFEYFFSTIVFI